MQSMERLWWCHITRANQFVRRMVDSVLKGKNVYLLLPEITPWYDTMYELVEQGLQEENPNNSLVSIDCPSEPVGEYLLENFCKKEKRFSYRPGLSYAEFLARNHDIVLHSRYIWVRGVSPQKRKEWSDFIADYRKNIPDNERCAVFILELQEKGSPPPRKGFQIFALSEEIDPYDRYTFCALASADAEVSRKIRPYLAELVSTICGNDLELCVHCIQQWQLFLCDPAEVLRRAGKEDAMGGNALETHIWESQVKQLFPLVEKYRSQFIAKHRAEIERSLPFENAFGEEIHNPQDVELGGLSYLAGQKKITLSEKEDEELVLYKKARNDLAHLTPLPFAEAEKILESDL